VVVRVQVGEDVPEVPGEADQSPDGVVLGPAASGLTQRRPGHRTSRDEPVGAARAPAGEESEVRSAMKRPDDGLGAGGQDLRQRLHHGSGLLLLAMRVAPDVEGRGVELADQPGRVGLHQAQLSQMHQQFVPAPPGVDRSRRLLPQVVGIDDGNVDAVLPNVARDLPQVAIRLGLIGAEPGVLALHEQDRPVVRDLEVGQFAQELAEVQAHALQEGLVRLPQGRVRLLHEPAGQPPRVVVAADVRPRAQHHPHAGSAAQFHEAAHVRGPVKREPPLAGLVLEPGAAGGDGVEPGLPGGGDAVRPRFGRHAGVLDRGPENPRPATVEGEALPVKRDAGHDRECNGSASCTCVP
jgi:hypothetical protein